MSSCCRSAPRLSNGRNPRAGTEWRKQECHVPGPKPHHLTPDTTQTRISEKTEASYCPAEPFFAAAAATAQTELCWQGKAPSLRALRCILTELMLTSGSNSFARILHKWHSVFAKRFLRCPVWPQTADGLLSVQQTRSFWGSKWATAWLHSEQLHSLWKCFMVCLRSPSAF